VIVLEQASKRYGSVYALRDVTMQVGNTERLAVVGPNGSGKSTLLKLMAGMIRPSNGEVSIDGEHPRSMRKHIGYAGHDTYLYPYLTIYENLELFASLYGVDYRRVEQVVEMFHLGAKKDAPAGTVSHGQSQRASLARAFLHQPSLLLLDEPFTGLDEVSMTASLDAISAAKGTVVIVTHDLKTVAELGCRVAELQNGRLR
jgi:heme exporter protein A